MYGEIDRLIDSDDVEEVLDGMSKDQFTDDEKIDEKFEVKSGVFFTGEVYSFIKTLIKQSKEDDIEHGAFLLGNKGEDDFKIIIDDYTSEFEPTNGKYGFGSAVNCDEQINEFKDLIKEKGYDSIIHFHVHTVAGDHYDGFADQDRKLYSWLARNPELQLYTKEELEKFFETNLSDEECIVVPQYFETRRMLRNNIPVNRKVSFYGMLASPDRPDEGELSSNYQLSLLSCEPYIEEDELRTRFYRFPNLYYIDDNNNICKIGSFVRRNPPVLTNGILPSNDNVDVQAIGVDPNSGEVIEDAIVGYYKDGKVFFLDDKMTQENDSLLCNESQNQYVNGKVEIQYGNNNRSNDFDEEER